MMTNRSLLERFLVCANCHNNVQVHGDDGTPDRQAVLRCTSCDSVFPMIDGIPILLKDQVRSPALELPLFDRLSRADFQANIWQQIQEQKARLQSTTFSASWEWEDVEFWDRTYQEAWNKCQAGVAISANTWPERVLQREPYLRTLTTPGFVPDGAIVETGCGSAAYYESLLLQLAPRPYIGFDMSIHALKIKRHILNHPDAIYALASIDNPPIQKESSALLLVAGILHHSERKEQTLPDLFSLLQQDGVMFLDEVLTRPSFLRHSERISGVTESVHEESVDYPQLRAVIDAMGIVERAELFNTPFYTACTTYLNSLLTWNRLSYTGFRIADTLCMRTLGAFIPSFAAGQGTFIIRRRVMPPASRAA